MQKTKTDLIAWYEENKNELSLLSFMPDAIKRHALNPEEWNDQFGDIQKDLVLAIQGYSALFQSLTGVKYQP